MALLVAIAHVLLAAASLRLAAQPSARASWTVAAPDAALAWFSVLAESRLESDGAFRFTRGGVGTASSVSSQAATLQRLRGDPVWSVLHFVPLYYPSADRAALASALRASASSAAAPAPRATFLTSALERTVPSVARREHLPSLATALHHASPTMPTAAQLAALQQRFDSVYLPSLAPHLARERLDGGILIVAPALGAEGRLFVATTDRRDNLAAVGTFPGDPNPEAPLLAFVRETCFPAVSRAASAAGIGPRSALAARRSSLAAVRCGAGLLRSCLPTRVAAYHAFWLRRAEEAGLAVVRDRSSASASAQAAEFNRVFLPDSALEVRMTCA